MSSREDRRADALEWTRELLYGYDAPRHEECDCVEPHEDPKHCAPWLKEYDGEPKETDE